MEKARRMRSVRLAVALLIGFGLLMQSCVTQQSEQRSILEKGSEHDRGVVFGRLPACERGQVAGDDGVCLDVPVTEEDGGKRTMRERMLERDCERAAAGVAAAARRRAQILATPGHEVHLGLNALTAECTVREERLDVCERAGRYDVGAPYREEKVRQRDALNSCRQLTDLYRRMLAQGLRHAP